MKSLTGLSHSGFDVEDLDRTLAFYTKVLGAKLQWRLDQNVRTPLMKLYIGDFGLSILKRAADAPRPQIPHAIHFAYRADPAQAEAMIEHVRGCGVEVEGPVGHLQEPENVSWFFSDPDDYRLEIEAHYASGEQAAAVVERGKAQRRPELGLYGGDPKLKGASR